MRRSGRLFAAAVLLLLAVPASGVAQTASVGAESPGPAGSPVAGGSLTIDVPDGAAPAGTTVTVVARDPSERPDELATIPTTLTFYEVEPADVTFSTPATVTRTIGVGEVGIDQYDPFTDGVILGSLFTRAGDGTWAWLQDASVGVDEAAGRFAVTATTDHGGPILADIVGNILLANEDGTTTPVGETFHVEGQVRVDATSRADIAAVTGSVSDETIAKVGDTYDVTFFDRAEGIEFQCLAPGTVHYETTFTVHGVADVGPLTAVSLGGTDVSVTQSGDHTCG
jgi:hypothetical protein